MQHLRDAGKFFVGALALGLLAALPLRAQTTTNVDTGSETDFQNALDDVVASGGGTIVVTVPIEITDSASFDGQSEVVVSGGNTNSILLIDADAGPTFSNLTFVDGFSTTNGGAVYVSPGGSLTLGNCTFSNNAVIGTNGSSAPTNSPGSSPLIGGNGGRGAAGQSVSGGAIFSLGTLVISDCQFLTNSAIGGSGGNGAPGVDGTTRGGNGGGGGKGGSASGGGIFSAGSLSISNTTFSLNFAQAGAGGAGGAGGGGGIVSGQSAGGGPGGTAVGAGLYTADTNGATILACTFYTNVAEGGTSADGGTTSGGNGQNGPQGGNASGGGIDNAGLLSITNSTFFKNVTVGGGGGNGGTGAGGGTGGNGGNAAGGGLCNLGTVTVVNCTFSMGGAIGGTNGVGGSGVATSGGNGGRGARRGGNIANLAKKKKDLFILANSIVGKTLSGPGSYGTIIDGGFNISADKSIPFKPAKKHGTSLTATDPKLGDLADNGGPTETIALPTNSLAVDFINPNPANPVVIDKTNTVIAAPDVDQRGQPFTRPVQVFTNDWSDAGAFELNPDQVLILKQPQSTNVLVGSNATFSVTAQGPGPLAYQWYFNPSNLPPAALTDPGNVVDGATSGTLTISDAQPTNQGFFIVVVTNAFSAATSRVAALTVSIITNTAPVIASLTPTNQSVPVGTNITITVTATGTPSTFGYQWFFQNFQDGTVHPVTDTGNNLGSTSNILSITNVQITNNGNYFVMVTNSAGSTNSPLSTLIVTNASTGTNSSAGMNSGALAFPVSFLDKSLQPHRGLPALSLMAQVFGAAKVDEAYRVRGRNPIRYSAFDPPSAVLLRRTGVRCTMFPGSWARNFPWRAC